MAKSINTIALGGVQLYPPFPSGAVEVPTGGQALVISSSWSVACCHQVTWELYDAAYNLIDSGEGFDQDVPTKDKVYSFPITVPYGALYSLYITSTQWDLNGEPTMLNIQYFLAPIQIYSEAILEYTLTIEDYSGGLINLTPGDYPFLEGFIIQLRLISVSEGYQWGGWLVDGVHIAESPFTIVMDQNHTVQPQFTAIVPPVCTEGDQRCEGYDRYVCQGNAWVLLESNSTSCGYVPPTCTEGDTKCEGFDLYECQGGEWVLIEANSAQCGYVVPPIKKSSFIWVPIIGGGIFLGYLVLKKR